MADDLRIYELADTQAAYDPDIVVAVDDAGFSNTKQMPIDAIYKKIDFLDAAGTFNPATSNLRLSDGGGVADERNVTVNNLLSNSDVVTTLKSVLTLNTTLLAFSGTSDTGVTATDLDGSRRDKVQVVTGQITVTSGAALGSELYIRTITDYASPGYNMYYSCNVTVNATESGTGRIATDGKIYITPMRAGVWRFNVTIIGA